MSEVLGWVGDRLVGAGKGILLSLALLVAYRLVARRSARVRRLSAASERLVEEHPGFATGTFLVVAVAGVADMVAFLMLTQPRREPLLTVGLVAAGALLTLLALALVRHALALVDQPDP